MFGSRDVDGHAGSRALGVGHFSEYPAAGAGDPFDRGERAVGIGGDVHRWDAVFITVLGGDLTVFRELGDDGVTGMKFSFAVGHWHAVNVSGAAVSEPW